ncbi:MAG: hypothetical protein HYS81_03735 [Candidatus Aenigmatarchaeota archaeon]|nr:MAG: hypothetical protein HYS81_03735 [Candidatus Aenigmarchaeota archaeon]
MADRTRLTAVKAQIGQLAAGIYHAAQGFESAYVITKEGMRVSRARVLGTVMNKFVSEDNQYGFLVLDDETETIRVKFFKNVKPLEGIEIGDFVDVIGKIKKYEGELYVQPEIMRKVEDPNFLLLRLAELAAQKKALENAKARILEIRKQISDTEELKKLAAAAGISPELAEAVVLVSEAAENTEDKKTVKERVLAAIVRLDDGSGAEYGTVIKEVALPEAHVEPVINELLESGACYEPRPGRVKKL